MGSDNPVDNRQSKPNAVPQILGRKKRIKDALARSFIHADAGIGDSQTDAVSGKLSTEGTTIALNREHFGSCAQGDRSTMWHSVTRIATKVENDLLNLVRIALEGR